jgi:hypothetical protein
LARPKDISVSGITQKEEETNKKEISAESKSSSTKKKKINSWKKLLKENAHLAWQTLSEGSFLKDKTLITHHWPDTHT